jgi:hypothetical protein
VDNTADLNKPLSTDTQNALDLKLDLAKIGLANGRRVWTLAGKFHRPKFLHCQ